jgi:hypothetical protein
MLTHSPPPTHTKVLKLLISNHHLEDAGEPHPLMRVVRAVEDDDLAERRVVRIRQLVRLVKVLERAREPVPRFEASAELEAFLALARFAHQDEEVEQRKCGFLTCAGVDLRQLGIGERSPAFSRGRIAGQTDEHERQTELARQSDTFRGLLPQARVSSAVDH